MQNVLVCPYRWGAFLSYIFFLKYGHEFKDYYFLSMLQKLMFPKEFYIEKGNLSKPTPNDITSGTTGLWPLDGRFVWTQTNSAASTTRTEATVHEQEPITFWQFVQARFAEHLQDLVESAGIEYKVELLRGAEHAKQLWDRLVEQGDFIEVPSLKAPAARALFLFQDADFFNLLQEDHRFAIRNNPNYQSLDAVEIKKEDFDRVPASGAFDIRYYFLSGFFQNIIDFLKQDIVEIRDGTDPIYPVTEEQQEEAYYVRLANGRAIYQVVERSRSLEVGEDYIGTCPYIFLVHLMALHNEFLVRKYELKSTEVQDKLSDPGLTEYGDLQALLNRGAGQDIRTRELQKATQLFYAFRYKAFSVYKKHLYLNTLRYNSERDVFEMLEQIRSTEPRLRRCDEIAAGLDKTIQDIEEERRYREQRLQSESDRILNLAVLGVAIFSAFQVLFQIADKLDDVEVLLKNSRLGIAQIALNCPDDSGKTSAKTCYGLEMYTVLDFLSITFLVLILIVSIRWIARRLIKALS